MSLAQATIVLWIAVASWALIGCAGSTHARVPQLGDSGDAWVRAMARRYATCRTYAERGRVSSAVRHDGQDSSTTDQQRLQFRIEFDREKSSILFKVGSDTAITGAYWGASSGYVNSWWVHEQGTLRRPVAVAMDSFSGITLGASSETPARLLGIKNWTDNLSFSVDGEELVRGVACVRLRAVESGTELVLWVSRYDLSVRRAFHRQRVDPRVVLQDVKGSPELVNRARIAARELSPFSLEVTVDYTPEFDRQISADQFMFDPSMPNTIAGI